MDNTLLDVLNLLYLYEKSIQAKYMYPKVVLYLNGGVALLGTKDEQIMAFSDMRQLRSWFLAWRMEKGLGYVRDEVTPEAREECRTKQIQAVDAGMLVVAMNAYAKVLGKEETRLVLYSDGSGIIRTTEGEALNDFDVPTEAVTLLFCAAWMVGVCKDYEAGVKEQAQALLRGMQYACLQV